MGMTIEQCYETLFKTIEILFTLQLLLFGVYGVMALDSLNKIEKKLNRLLEDKNNDTGL